MYPVFWCILANVPCVLVYPCQNREFALVPEIARADNVRSHWHTLAPSGTQWHPVAHISRAGTTLQETQNREAYDEKHCDDGEVLVMVMVLVMMVVVMMVVMVLFY